FLLRHRHAPQAKQRLGNVVMIIVIQVAFDLKATGQNVAASVCASRRFLSRAPPRTAADSARPLAKLKEGWLRTNLSLDAPSLKTNAVRNRIFVFLRYLL